MAEDKTPTEPQGVTYRWMQITQSIARGRLAPEEGVTLLQSLADENPDDREWLRSEIETIRRQFGMDVADRIRDGQHSYWDKLRLVIEALLGERLEHERALELLALLDADYPEHAEHTSRLAIGLAESPMRRSLEAEE